MLSASVERFLKVIYNFEERGEKAKAMIIASKLGISGAAVADMAGKLDQQKLVNYKKHKGIELTKKGRGLALMAVRKHRIWETFLYKVLKLDLTEIHTEAEYFENYSSAKLLDVIDEYLEYPSIDPHGDPIPDENGLFVTDDFYPVLTNVELGNYQVKRVVYDSPEVAHFFSESGLKLGIRIELILKFKEDNSLLIKIDKSTMVISNNIASKIFVKQIIV